jgi:AIR synthase-related protein
MFLERVMMLPELARTLRAGLGVDHKRDIQVAAQYLPRVRGGPWGAAEVRIGDDTAAIPDGDGYLLLAAEGMWPELVASEPRFAGYCAVMVNASDVYAMGGRPLAIVDALFAGSAEAAAPMLQGMADASERFQIPIVGGHTNLHSPYPALAAAVLGRARRLLTSFDARVGDDLVAAIDLRGRMHPRHAFWNASTDAAPTRLRADYAILPRLAEEGGGGGGGGGGSSSSGAVSAAKDISMGGIVGTTLMLCEASGVGATLRLDKIPRPSDGAISWEKWLLAFPSYGFLLAVSPADSARVCATFAARDIAASVVGRIDDSRHVSLADTDKGQRAMVWDLAEAPLTGFGGRSQRA